MARQVTATPGVLVDEAAVEELETTIKGSLEDWDDYFDDGDIHALAHKLVRLGWTRHAADPDLSARVERLERWAQGSAVTW